MKSRSHIAPLDWSSANQAALMAELAVVRQRLERYCEPEVEPPASVSSSANGQPAVRTKQKKTSRARAVPETAVTEPGTWSALDQLCAVFGLTLFERELLLLCAGNDLDAKFGPLCAAAQGDPRRTQPTFSLALSALAEPHWSALSPNRPLRYWRLIEVGAGENLTTSGLRIDERTLHFLTAVGCLDERLHGLVRQLPPAPELPPSQQKVARQLAHWWQQPQDAIVQFSGDDREGACAIVAAACSDLGIQIYSVMAADLPASATEREAFNRLWQREAIFSNSALLVDADDLASPTPSPALLAFLDAVQGIVVVVAREPVRLRHRAIRRIDVHKPSATEQRALWRQALGPAAAQMNGQVESAVAQFSLGLHAIQSASREVLEQLPQYDGPEAGAVLWDACRAQSRPRLDDLAQRIEPKAGWDDLVIPAPQLEELHNIAIHVRQRARVYDDWGFAGKCARGLGISALFSGTSGTGKTMAAEVLAGELNLDLYRIDLSAMVSKYIGETEKNLRRVFAAAEDGGAILLFDEADALFGKRSEVKDSHDRYANIEVSYLLQQMETYRGLTILTTNLKSALDKAFLRRIRFVVQFPFPDAAQRTEIWRRVFPRETPTKDLDPTKLARLSIAGGNIRNIALNASFLAANAGEDVGMVHMLTAARSEYAKMEKPLSDAELGGWV